MLTAPPLLLAEVSWRVAGRLRPHCNYWVFAGLSAAGVLAHADPTRKLLWPRAGRVAVRVPAADADRVAGLDLPLHLGADAVALVEPTVRAVQPCADLHSPLVVIKNVASDADCGRAVGAQLAGLGVSARVRVRVLRRGVVVVKHARLVGYGVNLFGLSELGSLVVQSAGIGGKNSMGCGVFEPC